MVDEAVGDVIKHLVNCKTDICPTIEQRVAVVMHKGSRIVDQWLPTDKRARTHPI